MELLAGFGTQGHGVTRKHNMFVIDLIHKLGFGLDYCEDFLLGRKKDRVWMKTLEKWGRDKGDTTVCITYNLTPKSIVFEIGGYQGRWTSDMYTKYNSYFYVFEPIKEFASEMKRQFSKNKKITVIQAAAANRNGYAEIEVNHDRSSLHTQRHTDNSSTTKIRLINLSEFINNRKINKIDLMQINIEGAEYELIESLHDQDILTKIKHLQVQFHKFVPNAVERRKKVEKLLRATHHRIYNYPFVWESWERK